MRKLIIYYVYLLRENGSHSLINLCYKENTAKWWVENYKGPGKMLYQAVTVRDYEETVSRPDTPEES
jgi:hypothetical protein